MVCLSLVEFGAGPADPPQTCRHAHLSAASWRQAAKSVGWPSAEGLFKRPTPRHLRAAKGAGVGHPPRKEHTRQAIKRHTGDVTGPAKKSAVVVGF